VSGSLAAGALCAAVGAAASGGQGQMSKLDIAALTRAFDRG
jgi:hypothetical protein